MSDTKTLENQEKRAHSTVNQKKLEASLVLQKTKNLQEVHQKKHPK